MFDAVVVTDLTGRIIEWNAAAEKLFGYPREAVFSKNASLLDGPEEQDPTTQRMIEVMIKIGRWSGEARLRGSKGDIGICDTVVVPHADDYGRTVAAIFVFRDVTERKRMGERLRALEEATT